MGLVYKTTKWADSLWQRHVKATSTAREVVREGEQRQEEFGAFAEDVHARLYLRNPPARVAGEPPEWAAKMHLEIDNLAEWRQLRTRTQGDGLSAAIATETLLRNVLPQIEIQQKDDKQQGKQPGKLGTGGSQPGVNEKLRQALRKGVTAAKAAVDEAQGALEGVEGPLGLSRAGTGVDKPETLADMDRVREAYATVNNSYNLRRIAELAGRLSRLASSKKRTKVRPAIGAIKGIVTGGDVARVLPQELAPLASGNKLLALQALDKILRRKALSYLQEGLEPCKRGPIVVLVDESGSMRENGKEIWAKAVALALLTTATQQKRAWHLAGFQADITHRHTIEPNASNALNEIVKAISFRSAGGTAFDPVLTEACDVIEHSASMKRADVIIITDGEAEYTAPVAERMNTLRKSQGVTVYAIGVGYDFQVKTVLGPVSDQCVQVNPNADGNDTVAPILNLE